MIGPFFSIRGLWAFQRAEFMIFHRCFFHKWRKQGFSRVDAGLPSEFSGGGSYFLFIREDTPKIASKYNLREEGERK